MKEQQIHWCDKCNKEVQFEEDKHFIERDETLTFKGETVTVIGAKIPVCHVCNNEITDEKLDTKIMQSAIKLWEEKTGKRFK
ncbi:YgiT family zinc finger protein [Psychrobacillus phage Perkons]|nr:YgiT family zinc finger protein [Psychrobacillus phage Perkons]